MRSHKKRREAYIVQSFPPINVKDSNFSTRVETSFIKNLLYEGTENLPFLLLSAADSTELNETNPSPSRETSQSFNFSS